MEQLMIELVEKFGYFAVTAIIIIENIFPPIPSEVILTFGGFLTTTSKMHPIGVIIASTIGSVLGALILYFIGRILKAERLARLFESKLGRALHFEGDDVYKACDWFNTKGKTTILFCRFIPIVRSVISIPAGIAKTNMGIFLLFTTIGSAIWNTVLVYLGVFAGASWEKIVGGSDIFTKVTLFVLAAAFIIAAYIFIKKRFSKTIDKLTTVKKDKSKKTSDEKQP